MKAIKTNVGQSLTHKLYIYQISLMKLKTCACHSHEEAF